LSRIGPPTLILEIITEKRPCRRWYLEPAYGYGFASGHQQSIGVSRGLLIGIPRSSRNMEILSGAKGERSNPFEHCSRENAHTATLFHAQPVAV
jgi:hypothetical protein